MGDSMGQSKKEEKRVKEHIAYEWLKERGKGKMKAAMD